MKCNLSPTNYINTTALVMWNVASTHTSMKPMAHNLTHTGKVVKSAEENRWVLRADFNDATENLL